MLDESARLALADTRFGDVRWFEEVESTNLVAADLVRKGAVEGAAVVAADHQTAGRGRLGRRWHAPAGSSLLVSIVWRSALAAQTHLLPACVSVAAARACLDVAGVDPRLKWPNDLVVSIDGVERKLGGMLGEVVGQADDVAVIVGLGVNVNWDGPPPSRGVALNQLVGRPVDRGALLVALLRRLDGLQRELEGPGGPARVLDEYRARSATLGSHVRVDLLAGVVEGKAAGITDDGHLLVHPPEGSPRVVTAGDVVHVRPA